MSKGTEEKKFNRDTNIINVSSKRNFTFYVFLAKKYLEDFETVELHSLGQSCPLAVQAAENLARHGYATLEKIYTDTISVDRQDGTTGSKAKLFITMRKTKEFDSINAAWEKEREERGPREGTEQREPRESTRGTRGGRGGRGQASH